MSFEIKNGDVTGTAKEGETITDFSWSDVLVSDEGVNTEQYAPKSFLELSPGAGIYFESQKKKPCAWWRFWHYVFFGWLWHDEL